MSIETIIGVIVGVLTISGVVITIVRFFVENQKRIEKLTREIQSLQSQSTVIRSTLRSFPDQNSTGIFDRLMELSTEASKAVKAEVHSISIPVPSHNPSDLRIILSSDPEAAKVVGREFPISSGIAGWVYKTKEPFFQNRVASDPHHITIIDRAANTNYGEGAILTIPLVAGGRCYGVMQFLKSKGGTFNEEDVIIASRSAPMVTRLLIDLETSPKEDIPSIARGNTVTASVLFTDISSFSNIAAHMRTEATVALLNEYYSRLLQCALSKGGKLQEYVGDGLYISFCLDTPLASARAAILSALEMQDEFNNTLYSWQQYGLPVTQSNSHRIGIATGNVYQGLVGHPKERREKLVGPAINLAAHLCEQGNMVGGGILICDETADLMSREHITLKQVSLSMGKYYQVISNIEKQRELRNM